MGRDYFINGKGFREMTKRNKNKGNTMGHYDDCYDADAKEKSEKKHQEIKKELIELINKLDDNERELLIHVIKNIKEFESMIKFLKKMTK